MTLLRRPSPRRPLARLLLSGLTLGLMASTHLGAQATLLDKKSDAELRGRIAEGQFGSILHASTDLTGDGIADLVVGSPAGPDYRGTVDVYKGGTTGLATKPIFHYEGQMPWAQVGSSIVVADVNGDGRMDLVVGAANQSGKFEYGGAVLVFLGSARGLPAKPSQIIEGPSSGSYFGWKILSLGDFDGDGKADVAITAMSANDGLGAIYIHRGGARGLNPVAHQTLTGSAPWYRFGRVAVSGDANGDGIADIVVGSPSPTGGVPGMVWVYRGAASGYANLPSETLTAPAPLVDSDYFGDTVQLLGDVDGDGHVDLAVGAPQPFGGNPGTGFVAVFYGSAGGFGSAGRTQLLGLRPLDRMTHLGANLLGGQDIDGDGYPDLVVGTSSYGRPIDGSAYPGDIRVYRGGPSGLPDTASFKLRGRNNQELGTTLAIGDINGDGLPDLLSGSGWFSGRQAHDGIVRVFLGAGAGLTKH